MTEQTAVASRRPAVRYQLDTGVSGLTIADPWPGARRRGPRFVKAVPSGRITAQRGL